VYAISGGMLIPVIKNSYEGGSMDITIDASDRISISIFGCKKAGLLTEPVLEGEVEGRTVSRELTLGGLVTKGKNDRVLDVYHPVVKILFFD